MSLVHVGIDPGLTGSLCVFDPADRDIKFFDTPVLQIKSGKKMKSVMDTYAIVNILHGITANRDVLVTIEQVNAMPGMGAGGERQSMGATSAFNFGMGFGMWLGMLAAMRIPFQKVHPRTWKAIMMAGSTKDKDAGRLKAMQLFPEAASNLSRKKDHGRADALLMAAWADRTHFVGKVEQMEAENVSGDLFSS